MAKGKAPPGSARAQPTAQIDAGPIAGALGPFGLRALVFTAPGLERGPDTGAQLPAQLAGAAAVSAAAAATAAAWVWLDVTAPDAALLHTLEVSLRLTRSALHEALRADSRSHFKDYPLHAFMLLQVPTLGHGGGEGHAIHLLSAGAAKSHTRFPTQCLGICLRPGLVVTIHADPLTVVEAAWTEFAGLQSPYEALHPDRLLHALAEDVLALFLPLVDGVEERIDGLERSVFSGRNRQPLDKVLGLKRDLLAMRRTLAPLRDAFSAAARRDSPLLPHATRVLLGDLYDRSLRIMDILENLRDLLATLLDAHLTVQSHRLSEIMRTLTVIATLMMPLTVITGYFGMNFVYLPGLDSAAAVWVVTGAMGLVALAMLAYFRSRGWY